MFELTPFIDDCRSALAQADPPSVVSAMMYAALEDPESVRRTMEGQPGGERFLCHAHDLTILNVTLPPGLRTPPHDHTMWAVIGIYEGQEDNTFFREEDDDLTASHSVTLKVGDVLVISPEDIHAIANPSTGQTGGLHVYGGDLPAAGRSLWHPTSRRREAYRDDAMRRYVGQLMQNVAS
jgi:predicted metal-dependent enzyme (double-stranded beta helix superfamily)